MPIELEIKCSGGNHRLEISQPKGEGSPKVEMLDHPSLELLQGFSAFGAKKAPCQQALEDITYSFADYLKEPVVLRQFLRHMRTKRGRTSFFESPPAEANKALERLFEEVLTAWINTVEDDRQSETVTLIGEFIEEPQFDEEEDEELKEPNEWLQNLFMDVVSYAIEDADDSDAVEVLMNVTSDIPYNFQAADQWPTEDRPGYKKVETKAELEIGRRMVASWDICLEGSFASTSLDDWSVNDCGSDEPDSAAAAFLDVMYENYSDPEEIVEIDEPDVPMSDDEGGFSVWDGSELLAVFEDEYNADEFYEIARDVAEEQYSGTSQLEIKHLTAEAMEQYMDEDADDPDFTDPDNWE